MPVFPSVEWFNAIKDVVNADPKFRQSGTIDVVFGVKVGEQIYEITFEAFECTGARQASEADLPNMDFWLEQSFDAWKDMIDNIKAHGGADLSHTLNTVDLTRPEGFAQAHDGLRRDAFYRFNQSIQDYFDASAKIDTQYKATIGA
jgi:hypothetical protein